MGPLIPIRVKVKNKKNEKYPSKDFGILRLFRLDSSINVFL